MELIKRIDQDLLASLRERQSVRTAVLRMLKSGLKNFAIAKRVPDTSLTDEQTVGVIRQEVKKRKESIEAFLAGGRAELADKERTEQAILESYLPPSLSPQDLKKVIDGVIADEKLTLPIQFGRLMGLVVKKVAGRTDGDTVKTAVQLYLKPPAE
jgi:hypothetical protein